MSKKTEKINIDLKTPNGRLAKFRLDTLGISSRPEFAKILCDNTLGVIISARNIETWENETGIPWDMWMVIEEKYPNHFWWLFKGVDRKENDFTEAEIENLKEKIVKATKISVEIEMENESLKRRNDMLMDTLADLREKFATQSRHDATDKPNKTGGGGGRGVSRDYRP